MEKNDTTLIGRAKICCGVCADGCKRYGLATTGTLVEAGAGFSPVEVVSAAGGGVEDTDGTLRTAGTLTMPPAPGYGQTLGGAL